MSLKTLEKSIKSTLKDIMRIFREYDKARDNEFKEYLIRNSKRQDIFVRKMERLDKEFLKKYSTLIPKEEKEGFSLSHYDFDYDYERSAKLWMKRLKCINYILN